MTWLLAARRSFGPSQASMRSSLELDQVAVVVPAWNDSRATARLIASLQDLRPGERPHEIIVVDDGSTPALRLGARVRAGHIPVRVLRVSHGGPAVARNVGWRSASSRWILFLDSDCIAIDGLLQGYRTVMDGSVAYQGAVRAMAIDELSLYFERQGILAPPPDWRLRPTHVVTANVLMWRDALVRVGGFDETFPMAAGEDIDLGLRLRKLGDLCFAPHAVALHDFAPTVEGFIARFERYGRGNAALDAKWRLGARPAPFQSRMNDDFSRWVALLQFEALSFGYSSAHGDRAVAGDAVTRLRQMLSTNDPLEFCVRS